jgi:hypothetical protein
MDKKQLAGVLNIREKNVTDAMLKYRYVEYPLNCCNDTPIENLIMFPGIGDRDYNSLSDKIKKYYANYKTTYLKKLADAPKKYNVKTSTWKQDAITDNFMRIYAHSRPNLKMMIVINGTIPTAGMVYHKTFTCDYCQVINIIYQASSTFIKFFNNESVYKFAEMAGVSEGAKAVSVNVYWSEDDITQPTDFHIVSPGFEVNGYWSNMFLNENSMRLTRIQKLNVKFRYKHARSVFQTYKNLMSKNFSALERDRTLIFSGTIFFSLGLRPSRDLDFYIHNNPDPKPLLAKAQKLFNDHDKGKSIDCAMQGLDEWQKGGIKEHWDQFIMVDWPKSFGASHMEDVILDPKFHYYYLGCKFIKMEADLMRKASSMRPSHMGDILMLSTYPEMKIDVPVQPMPLFKKTLVSGVEMSIDSRESLLKQLKLVKSAVNYKYKNHMSVEDLADLFPNAKVLRDMLDGKVVNPKSGGKKKPKRS